MSEGADVGTWRDLNGDAALLARAAAVIPGGTNTISKRVAAFGGQGRYPAYLVGGEGAHVIDAQGNRYLDCVGALAPIVLGYNHPAVAQAIADQLRRGALFSLPTPAEVALSELLVELIPCAEMVRLVKTGAEANSAAIRIARLHTGRETILSCGYQGWHDWWAATRHEGGIPGSTAALTKSFAFGDLDHAADLARAHAGEVACIIVTPALYGRMPPPGFLEGLRALADDSGAVLIFDEIITGFRWDSGGMQALSGVTPDLATFAKAMANGMPIAAVAGRRTLMAESADNWISSTYASEALSIAAALATIGELRATDAVPKLWALARAASAALGDIAARHGLRAETGDAVPALRFDLVGVNGDAEAFRRGFMADCAAHGLLIRRDGEAFSLCFSAAMTTGDIATAAALMDDALGRTLAG